MDSSVELQVSSDHYVVGCCINDFSKPPSKKKQELFVRDKSALNSELYCEDLANNLSIYFEKLPALNTDNYTVQQIFSLKKNSRANRCALE